MFFIISKLFAFLINPTIWIFGFLISALLFKSNRKKILYITLFVFFTLTNKFFADSISKIWETPEKAISSLKYNYKYGIVLGGYSSYNKSIEHINLNEAGDRIISAIELYKLGKIEKIILAGGNGELINDKLSESEWSRTFLINMGVEGKDIILEKDSRNTIENAENTAALLKDDIFQKSLLITCSRHMKRAKFCFNKYNFNIDCYPTDATNSNIIMSFNYLFIPNINALKIWEELIKEWIGYTIYRITF